MKVGISFVSTQDAVQNLQAEDPGWSVQRVAAAGAEPMERAAGPYRHRGWHRGRAAHLLHGAVPLAPLPQCGLRRERPVRRE